MICSFLSQLVWRNLSIQNLYNSSKSLQQNALYTEAFSSIIKKLASGSWSYFFVYSIVLVNNQEIKNAFMWPPSGKI